MKVIYFQKLPDSVVKWLESTLGPGQPFGIADDNCVWYYGRDVILNRFFVEFKYEKHYTLFVLKYANTFWRN